MYLLPGTGILPSQHRVPTQRVQGERRGHGSWAATHPAHRMGLLAWLLHTLGSLCRASVSCSPNSLGYSCLPAFIKGSQRPTSHPPVLPWCCGIKCQILAPVAEPTGLPGTPVLPRLMILSAVCWLVLSSRGTLSPSLSCTWGPVWESIVGSPGWRSCHNKCL